jgi:hypothetical protein
MAINAQSGVFGLKRQGSSGSEAAGPYNAGYADTNTKQTITFTGTNTGDTFKLTVPMFSGDLTTAAISWDGTGATLAGNIGTALDAVVPGGVTVTGTGPFVVEFDGDHEGNAVPLMTATKVLDTNSSMTIEIAMTQTGGKWHWLPALNVAFQPNQMVQTIPAEVGGSLWARGSYKGGVYGGGNVTMIPRGGLGLAELLYAYCGGRIDATDDDTKYGKYDGSDTTLFYNKLTGDGTNGVAANNFKYMFRPDAEIGRALPWYTFVRNVGGKFVEIFPDGHLGSFSFDMAASNLLQIDASFTSKSCAQVSKTSGGTAAQQVGAQLAGNGSPFQMVDAIVKLDTNNNGVVGAAVEYQPYNPTRLNIAFNNELSQNEFVVGSFFLQDITNTSRTAQITYSVYLRDAEIYNRVYSHGYAPDANGRTAWSSEVWKGALEITLTGAKIGSTSDYYTMKISVPEMDYMAAPISLAGNNLVEFQLTANVVLSQSWEKTDSGVWPFTIEYTTDENILGL